MVPSSFPFLKICFYNARSILPQINELQHFLHHHNIDIMLLNETFLKPTNKFSFPNYTIHRNDRPPPNTCGGTAIIIKSSIIHSRATIPPLTSIETTAITIERNNDPILIVSAYKPPNKTLLTSDLNILFNITPKTLIAGDLNSKHPNWNCRVSNPAGSILLNYLNNNPEIDITSPLEPTFYPHNPNHQPDVLDIALSRNITPPADISVLQELDSDHRPVVISYSSLIPAQKPPFQKITERSINWPNFQHFLVNDTINLPLSSPDEIDNATSVLQTSINMAISEARKRPPTNKQYNFSLPPHIVEMIRTKNKTRKLFQTYRDPQLKNLLNRQIRQIRSSIQDFKSQKWEEFISSQPASNPHTIPRMFLKKRKPLPALIHNNSISHTDHQKCNTFSQLLKNKYQPFPLTNKHIKINCTTFYNTLKTTEIDQNTIPVIKSDTIRKKIKFLSNSKAPGPDNIPNIILKHLPDSTVDFITAIFNSCLKISYFPSQWKTSHVTLIPKPNKSKTDPNNYRPIHLLNTLSKVFESVIKDYLHDHLEDNDVIPSFQFGFRPQLSTTIQLTNVVETIRTNFNRKIFTGLLLLDVEQAFDKVPHDALILKLVKIGTPLYLTKLIQNYLTNRHFQVKINSSLSQHTPVAAGVPQGSVLGPMLFNIFLNDIPQTIDHRISLALYADDIAIISSSKDPIITKHLLERQLSSIDAYLNKWGMRLNINKSQPILFTPPSTLKRRKTFPTLKILHKGQSISFQKTVKYLGVTLDPKLSFNNHITNSCNKASTRIRQLYPILNAKSIPTRVGTTLYKSYIRPILTYASPCWVHTSETNFKKLQRIQNSALRIITKSRMYTPITELHNMCGTETLLNHIQHLNKNFILKVQNIPNPTITASLLPRNPDKAKYPTPYAILKTLNPQFP
jgi:hypothetical protein